MYKINVMDQLDITPFEFNNISYPKFPASVRAKYCFDDEQFLIPDTEVYLSVDSGYWVIFDGENDNLFTMTSDQFLDIYIASNKKSQRYLEFVLDSCTNDYVPTPILEKFSLFEDIFGDLIEKEVPIKSRWRLILDLFMKKRIYLSRYL